MSNLPAYTGFENPMQLWYGLNPTLPVLFTGTYQTRQFGAGSANGLGTAAAASSLLPALTNPSAHMAAASNWSLTEAIAGYVTTQHDVDNYDGYNLIWPKATLNGSLHGHGALTAVIAPKLVTTIALPGTGTLRTVVIRNGPVTAGLASNGALTATATKH